MIPLLLEVEPHSSVDYQPSVQKLDKKAVDELLRYQQEIRQKHPRVIFEDSVELIRQAREDRTKELEER